MSKSSFLKGTNQNYEFLLSNYKSLIYKYDIYNTLSNIYDKSESAINHNEDVSNYVKNVSANEFKPGLLVDIRLLVNKKDGYKLSNIKQVKYILT